MPDELTSLDRLAVDVKGSGRLAPDGLGRRFTARPCGKFNKR